MGDLCKNRRICKWLSNTSFINFMLLFLACTMLRILIQLWGLCIFLYCYYYYGHDNNDITDIIVFSLIKANKKKKNRTKHMNACKNWFVLIVFKRSTFPKWFSHIQFCSY